VNSLLSTASDNDRCAFPRQRTGNREPDSGGRSCDQGFLSIQLQIHSVALSGCAEKLLHRNPFEAEISPWKEHQSADLCGAQAFMALVRRFTILKRYEWRRDDSLFRSGTFRAPFQGPLPVP